MKTLTQILHDNRKPNETLTECKARMHKEALEPKAPEPKAEKKVEPKAEKKVEPKAEKTPEPKANKAKKVK